MGCLYSVELEEQLRGSSGRRGFVASDTTVRTTTRARRRGADQSDDDFLRSSSRFKSPPSGGNNRKGSTGGGRSAPPKSASGYKTPNSPKDVVVVPSPKAAQKHLRAEVDADDDGIAGIYSGGNGDGRGSGREDSSSLNALDAVLDRHDQLDLDRVLAAAEADRQAERDEQGEGGIKQNKNLHRHRSHGSANSSGSHSPLRNGNRHSGKIFRQSGNGSFSNRVPSSPARLPEGVIVAAGASNASQSSSRRSDAAESGSLPGRIQTSPPSRLREIKLVCPPGAEQQSPQLEALSQGGFGFSMGEQEVDPVSESQGGGAIISHHTLNSMLIGRALSRHRVVDVDLLPPPPTGIAAAPSQEEDTLNVVGGGHSRRNTWNPSTHSIPPSPAGAVPAPASNAVAAPPSPTRVKLHRTLPSCPPLGVTSAASAAHLSPLAGAVAARVACPSLSSPLRPSVSAHGRMRSGDSPERGTIIGRPISIPPLVGVSAAAAAGMAGLTPRGLAAAPLIVDEVATRTLSPRLSARLTATASIRATLARQQSGLIGGNALVQQSIPESPISAAAVAPGNAADLTSTDLATVSPRRGPVLNDRRRHTTAESSGSAQRFLSPSLMAATATESSAPSSREQSPARGRASLGSQTVGAALSAAAAAAAKTAGVAAAPTDGRRTTRSRGRGRKLALIVDSNTLTQRLTSVALYMSGFTSCDVATGGECAVQMARTMRYDLILMESALPTMSGTDTARAIRFHEEQAGEPPVTILALTSAVDSASLVAYEAAKMNGAIERGAVVAEAVTEAVEALSRNGNFFFVAASGTKQQSLVQAPLQPLSIPSGAAVTAAHARAASASPHSASPYVASASPSPTHLSSSRPPLPRALSQHAGNNGGSAALSPRQVPSQSLHGRMPSTSLRRRATGTTHGALAAVTTTATPAAAASAHSIHIEPATAVVASSSASTPALSPSSAPTPSASA